MMKSLTLTVAVAAIGLALTGCGASAPAAEPSPAETRTTLQIAASKCFNGGSTGMEMMDAGKSMELRTSGKKAIYADGADMEEVRCVLDETGVSAATVAKMENTRALDGTMTDEWGDFEASWTYHPDSGFNVILEEKN